MNTSSELIKLKDLVEEFKDKYVIIPLLQRNYKWDVTGDNKGEATANQLLEDILNDMKNGKQEHTIGMATFYTMENKSCKIQIIDGQQRMITLSLLVKALGCYNSFPHIVFERDTDFKEREKFLCDDNVSVDSVDVRHMKAVYDYFNEQLKDKQNKKSIYEWMLEHIKIIRRYTNNAPLQEFLNLNEKKTAFSSTDYDRAYQLKYQAEKQKITPAMIIKEHSEIQKYLYTNDDVFNLINVRYPNVPNRMDLLFEKIKGNLQKLSDYYEKIDACGARDEVYKKCYEYLEYCHKVLRSISQELEKRDTSSLNVNIYNAVIMLYDMDSSFKFFDLIDIDNLDSISFEKKLTEQFNLLAQIYGLNPSKNAFMQSQLLSKIEGKYSDEKQGIDIISRTKYKESEQYVSDEILKLFDGFVSETEAIIEKGKNWSELVKGGKKSFQDILELKEIKQIIVPTIQRDYTFGSDEKKVLGLLGDISHEYISDCIGNKEYPKGSVSRIVHYFLKQGKLWDKIGSLNCTTKDKYEAYEIRNILFSNAAGISIYEYGYDWRGENRKSKLDNIMSQWGEKLELQDEDIDDIKAGSFFETVIDMKEEFLFSVIFGYLEDGDFYLYDGQQRMVTLVFLCAYIINQNYTYENKDIIDFDLYTKSIKVLRKFKFESRKEANSLLSKLLGDERGAIPIKDIRKELGKYVVDHSTYSIVNLLMIYENYKNNYGKPIISFNLEYLMKKVIFEFAVVKEASVADQMYMDLNSKNVPLTMYENYKAELVYYLSEKFKHIFDQYWKYQLDNSFLNLCYSSNDGWEKKESDKAEELEIKLIHWCFKMSCMEFDICIGEINDAKNRLRWMDETYATDIVKTVGELLNSKIMKADRHWLCKIEDMLEKSLAVNEFSWEEFSIWFDLRYKEQEQHFQYRFLKSDNYIKVYNLVRDEAKNKANYINLLAQESSIVSNSQITESSIIKLLLRKYHTLWEKGYLQADLIETLDGFYNINDLTANDKQVKKVIDYYAEEYMTKKPEDISWAEYIYDIKLNEMLEVERYEKVKIWEEIELKNHKPFSIDDKVLARKKFNEDYYFWKFAMNRIDDFEGNSIDADISNGVEIDNAVLDNVQNMTLKFSRMSSIILDKEVNHKVSIRFDNNQDIKSEVKLALMKKPSEEFLNKIQQKYYSRENNGLLEMWEFDDTSKTWIRISMICIGKIEIEISEMPDKFKKTIIDKKNSNENIISYTWWSRDSFDYDSWMKRNLKEERNYDLALRVLLYEQDDFKDKYRKVFRYLPHE